MRHFKKQRGEMPCAQSHADDGLTAKEEFSRKRGRKADQKTPQLCRQVQRSLSLALAGCADPILQSAQIIGVEPAPNASRLRVIVASGGDRSEMDDLSNRLAMVTAYLRRCVMHDIVRKRAPELVFVVLPSEGVAS